VQFRRKGARKLDDMRKERGAQEAHAKRVTNDAKTELRQAAVASISARMRDDEDRQLELRDLAKRSAFSLRDGLPDDTDGADEVAEFRAWEVREMKRLMRERESAVAREEEQRETERRRNLTDAERAKEDEELVALGLKKGSATTVVEGRAEGPRLRAYHRGAFYMDDDTLAAAEAASGAPDPRRRDPTLVPTGLEREMLNAPTKIPRGRGKR